MAAIRLLDSAVAADWSDWLASWQAWPGREVFAHPAYVRLFATAGPSYVRRAVNNFGRRVVPFLVGPLAAEPWGEAGELACDIVTPYGYGGAFAWNCSNADSHSFWEQFHAWADANRIVSSFARLSLFAGQQLPFDGEVVVDRQNVVRSLDLTPDELWQEFEHKVRKNVNRARRSGLAVEIDPSGRRLEDFLSVYYDTMGRRQASNSYYFPREFFETLVAELAGQFVFLHVLSAERVVSTELVLVSADHLYSFLGGTLAEAFAERPNDLLKHEIILWGRQARKRAFVLGGGYEADDGIYRYKKSFAPRGSAPFCVGRRIHNAAAYARLIESRRRWQSGWAPQRGYFPEYRA